MRSSHFILLIACVAFSHSSVYTDVKDNVLSFIQRSINNYNRIKERHYNTETYKDLQDAKVAQSKALALKKVRNVKDEFDEPDIDHKSSPNLATERYRKDPVLNFLSRRSKKSKRISSEGSSSSSTELQNWKDEWREQWIQKKFEAINSTAPTGDTVNMVAARPWGVPCGDPNQHDMPWGTCMLPVECEAEYRIYRGDYFCGRTQFVCCALQLTTYDMYQGFDVSFADSSLQTDSHEKKNRNAGSKERQRKKKAREKKRRRRERVTRKRKIKRNIRNIIKEIRKILSRSYRNGTTDRKRKTRQLKRFIKHLKRKYKKDRKSVKNVHETELMKIDNALQRKLDQIKGLNQNFIRNHTFRDIVVNGTVSPKVLRLLIKEYPELATMLDSTKRRSNDPTPDYLNYDIEYGLLYY